jgi:glycogen debranching enzyme
MSDRPTTPTTAEPAEPLFEGKAIKAGWWVILFNGWDPGLRYWTGSEWRHETGRVAGAVHSRHRIMARATRLPLTWRRRSEAAIQAAQEVE